MTPLERWKVFSDHMEKYIEDRTMEKYKTSKKKGFSLINMVLESKYGGVICLFCIMRYSIRMFNDSGKQHDVEKIAHYASFLWEWIRMDP